jgi:predicted lipoprotein with Yx(FWY)xxD motif
VTARRPRRARAADRRLTLLFGVGAVIALAVLIAPLVSRSGGGGGESKTGADDTAAVRVAHSKFGRILVNAQGRTLYLFLADKGTRSTCKGSCARVWPPLQASGTPSGGAGVKASELSTTRRSDGSRQVVYHGHPLYTMVADKKPGQTEGQAFLGTWFVVSPAGNAVTGGVKPSSGTY